MKITYLDVSASEFPADKYYTFQGVQYLLRFRKNSFSGYSVEVYTADGLTFLYANKIVYGANIIDTLQGPFPDSIVPLNPSRITGDVGSTEVADDTLGDEVKLLTGVEN